MDEAAAAFWPNTSEGWATLVQAAVTVAAVLGGVLLGYLRFGWFRVTKPHATISHVISHRRVGTDTIHLALGVTISNTSKVVLNFRDAFVAVQQISPSPDAEIAEILERQRQVAQKGGFEDMQWKTLVLRPISWGRGAFVVEPGEHDVRTYEFMFQGDVETVMVRSHFYNARVVRPDPKIPPRDRPRAKGSFGRDVDGPRGWSGSTVYDLRSGSTTGGNDA